LFFAARFACHAAQAVRVTMAKNERAGVARAFALLEYQQRQPAKRLTARASPIAPTVHNDQQVTFCVCVGPVALISVA
jgi:hypothetical protein